jgi:hypothetical protein
VVAIKESNLIKKKQNEEVRNAISSQLAIFKRHFYAACFEETFERVLKGDVP